MEETPGRASLEILGCRTPPQLHAGGVGRQQQFAGLIDPTVRPLIGCCLWNPACRLLFLKPLIHMKVEIVFTNIYIYI